MRNKLELYQINSILVSVRLRMTQYLLVESLITTMGCSEINRTQVFQIRHRIVILKRVELRLMRMINNKVTAAS